MKLYNPRAYKRQFAVYDVSIHVKYIAWGELVKLKCKSELIKDAAAPKHVASVNRGAG